MAMRAKNVRSLQIIAVCTLIVLTAGKNGKSQPNIVMIVADDLGWDDVSFHGSSQIPTPHIDKLANEGVILNGYYVSPICTPSRASFMTGKHPVNLGIQHATIFGTQPYGLPLGEITTPQYMKSLGYKTHGIGKWHLGFFEKEYIPTYRGFDSYYGFWNGKEDYWDHSSQEDVWGFDLRDNEQIVKNESGHYGTELYAQRAVQIIHDHNQSKPLYLYLAQQAVHSANEREPLQAPTKLVNEFSGIHSHPRRIYAGMVTALDISVGKVYKALKNSGMLDNTVLVFTTDNGGAPRGFNWNQGCNYPLKGGKDSFWEGGVRAVGFVHSKLINKKARVSTQMIDATDWLPTFYHLGGGDVSQIQDGIDGMNVWDTISDDQPSPRTEILHNIDPIRKFAAIRVNNYKLIVNQDAVYKQTWHPRYDEKHQGENTKVKTLPGAVVDCGQWSTSKGNTCDTSEFPCLFDISNDPCEYNTIANDNLHIVNQLLERLIQIQKQARPVWFPERDPKANPALFNGFWGPWRKNPANAKILSDMAAKIPQLGKKSKTLKKESNTNNQTAVYKGHAEFHTMLKKILKHTKGKNKDKKASKRTEAKKTTIFRNEKSRIRKKVFTLYTEMKEKTRNKEGTTMSSEEKNKLNSGKDHIINTDKLNTISRVKRSIEEASESQDDAVRSIVRQSIEQKHDSAKSQVNGRDDISYVIKNMKEDSQIPQFTHGKSKNYVRRSEIPKPEKSRIETILESLSKAFGYS